jgi:hypothetical protein
MRIPKLIFVTIDRVCQAIYQSGSNDDFLTPKYCSANDFDGIPVCTRSHQCPDFLTNRYVWSSTIDRSNLSVFSPRYLGLSGLIFKNRPIAPIKSTQLSPDIQLLQD